MGTVFRSAFAVVADGDSGLLKQFEDALGMDDGLLIPNGPAAISTPSEIMVRAHEVLEQAGWSMDRRNDSLASGIAAAEMGALVPIGDVAGAMSELVRCGVKVAIATSDGRANARNEIDELRIMPTFLPSPVATMALRSRILKCCSGWRPTWGLRSDRMVYVGDSEQDRRTAESANVRFIEVRPLGDVGIGSDYWVHSISEIADIVVADKQG